jgi:hypothetical protein
VKRSGVSARVRANRRNAQRSSGPKTAAGKAKSSRNARRHGLSSTPGFFDDPAIEALAALFAGEAPGPDLLEAARALAETDAQVRRARQLITATLETLLTENPATKSITEILEWVDPELAYFLDPEDRAWFRGDAPVDREELRLVASVLRQGDKLRRQQAAELSRRLRLFIRYEKAAAARRLRESQELRRKRAPK